MKQKSALVRLSRSAPPLPWSSGGGPENLYHVAFTQQLAFEARLDSCMCVGIFASSIAPAEDVMRFHPTSTNSDISIWQAPACQSNNIIATECMDDPFSINPFQRLRVVWSYMQWTYDICNELPPGHSTCASWHWTLRGPVQSSPCSGKAEHNLTMALARVTLHLCTAAICMV